MRVVDSVEKQPLDHVPLAQPAVQFENRGLMALVVLRPPIEDLRALGGHPREAGFEILQRTGHLPHLLESGADLIELHVQL